MNLKSILLRMGTALLVALMGVNANAALITASWTGTTDFAEADNAFGLQTGDAVSGSAQFDTDWLGQPLSTAHRSASMHSSLMPARTPIFGRKPITMN